MQKPRPSGNRIIYVFIVMVLVLPFACLAIFPTEWRATTRGLFLGLAFFYSSPALLWVALSKNTEIFTRDAPRVGPTGRRNRRIAEIVVRLGIGVFGLLIAVKLAVPFAMDMADVLRRGAFSHSRCQVAELKRPGFGRLLGEDLQVLCSGERSRRNLVWPMSDYVSRDGDYEIAILPRSGFVLSIQAVPVAVP